MNCYLCNSTDIVYKYDLNEKHKIYKCRKCSVEFLYPQLIDDELKELYSEEYYKSWGVDEDSKEETQTITIKKETAKIALKHISKYHNKGKILDIGCAMGYFLEEAKEKGFEPYGVEFSPFSSSIAVQKFGESNIFNGILEDNLFEKNSFSVITMFDLLEHVKDPVLVLKKAKELLKEDGIIVIATPDTATLSNKLMKKKWTHYKLEHLYYFNPGSIDHLTKETSLKTIKYIGLKKALNLSYFHYQFNVYRHSLITPIINILYKICPSKLADKFINLKLGESLVVLKKGGQLNETNS